FSTSQGRLKQARRRFVYEEFFLFQLKMQTYGKWRGKFERDEKRNSFRRIARVYRCSSVFR
ncbi:hypothetical protein, partial [Bacillus anthracis]|uniref:hypothetical protein n=1 Tax=Bacillus anthracis TaxID=1392 RepID=UPI001F52933A